MGLIAIKQYSPTTEFQNWGLSLRFSFLSDPEHPFYLEVVLQLQKVDDQRILRNIEMADSYLNL